MTKNVFEMLIEAIHFGLDHLEVYATSKYAEELFESLDFDNSSSGGFEDYNIFKTEVYKYEYKIVFLKGNHVVFAYYKGKPRSDKQGVPTRDYVVVYSTAFRILTLNEILYFLEGYFDLKECKRFDICMDIKANINDLLGYFKEPKTGVEYKKAGNIETKYFGEPRSTLNKRQLIRVYNKLLDTQRKKKIDLYADYFDYKDITRIELEVRRELAKNYNYRDLFDNFKGLIGIFKNYLKKHTDIFKGLPVEDVTLYRKPEVIPAEKYQSLYYRTHKKNIFVGHARTIFNMGFCPIRILIAEGLIQDSTKEIMGVSSFEELLERELQARANSREEVYLNKNWHEILNNLYKYGKM